jgi:hypothetical protein
MVTSPTEFGPENDCAGKDRWCSKSVTRKRLVKVEDFMCDVVTVIFGVCNSVRLIIPVLKFAARKRIVETVIDCEHYGVQ